MVFTIQDKVVIKVFHKEKVMERTEAYQRVFEQTKLDQTSMLRIANLAVVKSARNGLLRTLVQLRS